MKAAETNQIHNPQLPRGLKTSTDPALLRRFASDRSGKVGAQPLAALYPTSTEQVQQAIRWAIDQKLPVVPVSSSGDQRHYGDTVCASPAIILDLSGMNEILHITEQDAAAIIEAGTTYAQLEPELNARGLRAFRPLFVRGSKSVLAACLDRMPTTVAGKHWDSADPLAATEFVFGTGDLFRTGTAAMPGSLKKKLELGNSMLFGMGPVHTDFARVIQGSQGALAVLTWASVHCGRIPFVEAPYFFSSNDLQSLISLVYKHLRRRMEGQVFLLNAKQFKLMFDIPEDSQEASGIPEWIAYIELSSHDYLAEDYMAFRKADIERDAQQFHVSASQSIGNVPATELFAKQQRFEFESAAGTKNEAYQEVFCLSQLNRLPEHLQALEQQNLSDAAIYVQPLVHGVNAHCQLTYIDGNRSGKTLQETAIAAANSLADTNGFFSRPHFPWAHIPFERDKAIMPMIEKTKRLFDPAGILHPGAQSLGGKL